MVQVAYVQAVQFEINVWKLHVTTVTAFAEDKSTEEEEEGRELKPFLGDTR